MGSNRPFGFNGNGSGANKEAVLKKLLETQEIYIQELESKCKSMTDKLTESPVKGFYNTTIFDV
jgi:hypothetical protein